MADAFISEVASEVSAAQDQLRSSHEYRAVYKTSLAAQAVLHKLLLPRKGPSPAPAISIVKRLPVLVCARQLGACRIELRRFIELIGWHIYFRDHPVEWEHFEATPTQGFVREIDDPIAYCAHREVTFYLNYAKSRLKTEPSQLAGLAVDELRKQQALLNADVHPASILLRQSQFPLDDISETELREFNKTQKTIFSSACIIVASVTTSKFNALPPVIRAYFDWLVGAQNEKKIRSGPFGLYTA